MDSIQEIINTFNINLSEELANIENKIIFSNNNSFYDKIFDYIKHKKINLNFNEYIKIIENDNKLLLDYFCFRYIDFIRKIKLPNLNNNNKYEFIFINTDNIRNFEFIIRNNIFILGSNWNITIVCEKRNYQIIKSIIEKISVNIKIIKFNKDFNNLFIDLNFWKKINGENLLIADSNIIFTNNNFKNYMNNDFLILNESENFSIRKKSILIKVIKFVENIKNTFHDEKKFFTKRLDKFKLGNFKFLNENIPGSPINLNSKDLLTDFLKNINLKVDYEDKFISIIEFFNFNFCQKQYKYLLQSKQKYNYIEIDINFINEILNNNINDKLEYFRNFGIQNCILCNKNQILNFYPNANILVDLNNKIFVEYKKVNYSLKKFWNTYFINNNLNFFEKITIIKNKLKDSELIIIININNPIIGLDLIKKFYKKFKKYCFVVNFTCENYDDILKFICKNIKSYILTKTKNFGSDIEPFIIVYKYISKRIKFKYILKLHTKSDNIWRNELIEPFLNLKNDNLLKYFRRKDVGMIGSNKYIYNNNNFCKLILEEFFDKKCLKKFEYVAGTIFMCKKIIIDKTIKIFSKYLRALYIMIFYYDNLIFRDNSLRHSLERMFGICNKYLDLKIIGI